MDKEIIYQTQEQDAKRFQFLQNICKEQAQAFFWNYTSRKQRAKAIDEAIDNLNKGENK